MGRGERTEKPQLSFLQQTQGYAREKPGQRPGRRIARPAFGAAYANPYTCATFSPSTLRRLSADSGATIAVRSRM